MRHRVTLAAMMSVLAMATGGCASSPVAASASPVAASASSDLEREYLIGPSIARQLGLRIDLQTRTHPEQRSGIKLLSIQHDAIFVLDGVNFLTRLRRDDGTRRDATNWERQ